MLSWVEHEKSFINSGPDSSLSLGTFIDIAARLCFQYWHHFLVQSNLNGSNIFGTIEICSRYG